MRLYFLTLTPLSDVNNLIEPPQFGDSIIYVRRAQNPMGKFDVFLKKQNIMTYYIDDIIDEECAKAIDILSVNFLKSWFKDGEDDYSLIGDLSLGVSYSLEIAFHVSPRLLIKLGEALRRILENSPKISCVYSDACDGKSLYEMKAKYFPNAQIIEHVAGKFGYKIKFVEPVRSIPTALKLEDRNSIGKVVISYIGKFRLSWVRANIVLKRNLKAAASKPVLYFFVGRSQDVIVRELVRRNKFQVVCNLPGISGADSIRSDHLFALPTSRQIRTVKNILRDILRRSKGIDIKEHFVLGGVSYDKLLFGAVYNLIKAQIWAFLVVFEQSKKLQVQLKFSSLVINDALNEPMGNLVSLNRNTGLNIYLIPHGMNIIRNVVFSPAMDQNHITYMAYGEDHLDFFNGNPNQTQNNRHVLVGNPLTMAVEGIRSKQPNVHKKRLLILSFGHTDAILSSRIFTADDYYIGVFGLVQDLVDEGWEVTIRPHPYHGFELEQRIAETLGVWNHIKTNTVPSIEEALPNYDVVVANISSAYYQSMYAGWPTIFYEPDHRSKGGLEAIETDPLLTGLPTAKDLDRPVTNDLVVLAQMIRDSQDATSLISTFPKKFGGELAARFIGPDPAHVDQVITDYLERDYYC